MTGLGCATVNGWVGGGAMTGLGCGARTDLETSSSQRSASEGVRLWEGITGEDVGGTTITGVGADQLFPAERGTAIIKDKISSGAASFIYRE